MKTVLITGAGGAIGCHVLRKVLKETEWRIIATDSFKHKGEGDRIATVLHERAAWWARVDVVTHDLCAPFTERMIKQLGKIDYIINLASLSDVFLSVEEPAPFIENNVKLMLTMLELARVIKPEIFIQFSTDEVYGPIDKNSSGHDEWDVILPSNPYSASKAAQEAIAISYWRSYGVPLVITNTMNNFGEMQGATKFPAMVQKRIMRGEQVTIHTADNGEVGSRCYIHSENTADAVLFILRKLKPYAHKPGKVDWPDRFNIVGEQLTNLELAMKIAEIMGKAMDYSFINFHSANPGHDLHYGLNGEKLERLGWKAPISLEEGLKRTIEWTKDNPQWLD